jgi:hypothetical protein
MRFIKNLLSYLACNQIWLNLSVGHRHFGYNTKRKHTMTPEQKFRDPVHALLATQYLPPQIRTSNRDPPKRQFQVLIKTPHESMVRTLTYT